MPHYTLFFYYYYKTEKILSCPNITAVVLMYLLVKLLLFVHYNFPV